MSSSAIDTRPIAGNPAASRHRIRIWTLAVVVTLLVSGVVAYGIDYYWLPLAERALSPKHPILRPSGAIGLRLGMFGVFLFVCLYMYPLRKKWRWLGQFGKSRHWLDFHVLFGIAAPTVITLHSSFKFQGLAGVAYWLMIAVMASGIVGRYIYAKIPRRLNSAEISLGELEDTISGLTQQIERQSSLSSGDIARAFRIPSPEEVGRLSLIRVLILIMWLDLTSGLRVSRLRRSGMSFWSRLATVGGLLKSTNASLEAAVVAARQRARMQTRIVFLSRISEMFHLWHIIHRPFSYAFATFALIHILFMVMLGYY